MLSLVKDAAFAWVSTYASDQQSDATVSFSYLLFHTSEIKCSLCAALFANTQQIRSAVDQLPQVNLRGIATAWSDAIIPLCHKIRETVHEDVEHLVQVLAESEPPCNSVAGDVSDVGCMFCLI